MFVRANLVSVLHENSITLLLVYSDLRHYLIYLREVLNSNQLITARDLLPKHA